KDFIVAKVPVGYHVRGCSLGKGLTDAAALLEVFERAGRRPDLFVEQWMAPEDTTAATVARECDWIVHGLRYVRDILKKRGWIET
ncbi:MAG: hypothetical protein ACYS8K_03280, partial [Planctomycetota bacterium]